MTVSDPDVGQINTATVNFAAANGTVSDGIGTASAGSYTVSGTMAALQAALREFVFIPTTGQTTPGSTITTGFALSVSDGLATVTDSAATVVATAIGRIQLVPAPAATKLERSQTAIVEHGIAPASPAIP